MICNVVLVSAVEQSESVIHRHTCTLFKILFPHRSLQSIVPCAMQYILIVYKISMYNSGSEVRDKLEDWD